MTVTSLALAKAVCRLARINDKEVEVLKGGDATGNTQATVCLACSWNEAAYLNSVNGTRPMIMYSVLFEARTEDSITYVS